MLLQGDTRHAGDSTDGIVARAQIARILVESLTSDAAEHLTFELVAERGPAQHDLEPVFAALDRDRGVDGVRDQANLPAEREPAAVQADLRELGGAS